MQQKTTTPQHPPHLLGDVVAIFTQRSTVPHGHDDPVILAVHLQRWGSSAPGYITPNEIIS